MSFILFYAVAILPIKSNWFSACKKKKDFLFQTTKQKYNQNKLNSLREQKTQNEWFFFCSVCINGKLFRFNFEIKNDLNPNEQRENYRLN